jgi:PPOX class probable F420-dependent enzyme
VARVEVTRALQFASGTSNGVAITLKRDGRPQASNVTFHIDGGVIRFSATETRAKVRNLRRDVRLSFYVAGPDFGSYVVLEGDADVTRPAAATDDATVEALVDLYRRIAGEHPDWQEYREAMVADQRVVVSLRPTHAYGGGPTAV